MSAAVLSAFTPSVGVSVPSGDGGAVEPGVFSLLLNQANAQVGQTSAADAPPRPVAMDTSPAGQGIAFDLEAQTPPADQAATVNAEPIVDLDLDAAADGDATGDATPPSPEPDPQADPALLAGLATAGAQPAATQGPAMLAAMARPAAAPILSPEAADEATTDGQDPDLASQSGPADDGAQAPVVAGNAASADRGRSLSAAAPSQAGQTPAAQSSDPGSADAAPTAPKTSDNATTAAAATAAAAPNKSAPPVASEARPAAPAPLAPDAPPASAGSTLETSAAEPTRDLGLSQMSRVAIETTAQIAAQIVRRLEGRSTRFDMVLTPEHLGRVDVKLDIDSEGRLAARLAFDNPAAATDLRGRADELRRQLQDAGFQLAHDALDFSEREAGSGQMFDQRRERASAFSARASRGAEDDAVPASAWTPLSLTPRGVDLKV